MRSVVVVLSASICSLSRVISHTTDRMALLASGQLENAPIFDGFIIVSKSRLGCAEARFSRELIFSESIFHKSSDSFSTQVNLSFRDISGFAKIA